MKQPFKIVTTRLYPRRYYSIIEQLTNCRVCRYDAPINATYKSGYSTFTNNILFREPLTALKILVANSWGGVIRLNIQGLKRAMIGRKDTFVFPDCSRLFY